jgi:hypothetical protein
MSCDVFWQPVGGDNGNYIGDTEEVDVESCAARCDSTSECRFFNYYRIDRNNGVPTAKCQMLSSDQGQGPYIGIDGGARITDASATTTAPATTTTAAAATCVDGQSIFVGSTDYVMSCNVYWRYYNGDGAFIDATNEVNSQACAARCDETPGCRFFNYYRIDRENGADAARCELFNSNGSGTQSYAGLDSGARAADVSATTTTTASAAATTTAAAAAACIDGESITGETGTYVMSCSVYWVYYVGDGALLGESYEASAQACAARCDETLGCRFFNFMRIHLEEGAPTAYCSLLANNASGTNSDPGVDGGARVDNVPVTTTADPMTTTTTTATTTSDVSTTCANGGSISGVSGTYTMECNAFFFSSSMQGGNQVGDSQETSVQACAARCDQTEQCRFFNYANNGRCVMLSSNRLGGMGSQGGNQRGSKVDSDHYDHDSRRSIPDHINRGGHHYPCQPLWFGTAVQPSGVQH